MTSLREATPDADDGSRPPRRTWTGTSDAELAVAQLQAMDRLREALQGVTAGEPTPSREARVDRDRELRVWELVGAAMAEHSARALDAELEPWHSEAGVRAVIAHRHPWFVERLVASLGRSSFRVAACVEDGASALGVVVAEQPDLLVVADAMPHLPAEALLAHVVRFAPRTVVAVQVEAPHRGEELLAAGAAVAFSRQQPPFEVALDLEALVRTHGGEPWEGATTG